MSHACRCFSPHDQWHTFPWPIRHKVAKVGHRLLSGPLRGRSSGPISCKALWTRWSPSSITSSLTGSSSSPCSASPDSPGSGLKYSEAAGVDELPFEGERLRSRAAAATGAATSQSRCCRLEDPASPPEFCTVAVCSSTNSQGIAAIVADSGGIPWSAERNTALLMLISASSQVPAVSTGVVGACGGVTGPGAVTCPEGGVCGRNGVLWPSPSFPGSSV